MANARKVSPKKTKDAPPLPAAPPKNDWRKQRYETVPIHSISARTAEEDANDGDSEAIDESIEENGFFGAILVRSSDRKIIGGKTRWRELVADGETECPVIFLEVEPARADAINIAENHTRDHAGTNQNVLADQVFRLKTEAGITRGIGVRSPDIEALLERARPKLSFLEKLRTNDAQSDAPAPFGLTAAMLAGEDSDGNDDGAEPAEDYENEDAAGAPESEEEDSPDNETPTGNDPGRGATEIVQPRIPLAIALTNAEERKWNDYKKSVGERRDRDAFLVMLAAVTNTDDAKA